VVRTGRKQYESEYETIGHARVLWYDVREGQGGLLPSLKPTPQ
jgi:hypothetical protein